MTQRRVVFRAEAVRDLERVYDFLADTGSPVLTCHDGPRLTLFVSRAHPDEAGTSKRRPTPGSVRK